MIKSIQRDCAVEGFVRVCVGDARVKVCVPQAPAAEANTIVSRASHRNQADELIALKFQRLDLFQYKVGQSQRHFRRVWRGTDAVFIVVQERG